MAIVEDERLTQNEVNRQNEIANTNNTYQSMIEQSDKYYQGMVDATEEWKEQQTQLQNDKTDFVIEQINQQKEQANKDYIKEQSGAYVDWQKQSNQYGANAEQMAESGLTNTGYSESSQVSMYNTYQNRVAIARDSYNKAVIEYDNAIKDAQLQNNSALAEIAITALQKKSELFLQGFQYKNDLVLQNMAQEQAINNRYDSKWQTILSQINQEKALAEEIRQYNEKMAYQKEQDALAQAQWEREMKLREDQLAEEQRQFNLKNSTTVTANKVVDTASKTATNVQSAVEKIMNAIGGGNKTSTATSSSESKNETSLKSLAASKLTNVPSSTSKNASNPQDCGNSATTKKKSDYFFDNGYQPRYCNNEKLNKSGLTASEVLGNSLANTGIRGSQNVWLTGSGKYYVWDGESDTYIDVTNAYYNSGVWEEESVKFNTLTHPATVPLAILGQKIKSLFD